MAIAAAAVAGAADWWPQASVPALGLVAGIAVGVLLNVVAWVAWRRDYELSPAFAVPSYVLPIAAIYVGLAPSAVPAWAPMIAYGCGVAFAVGGAALSLVGLRLRARLGDEQAGEQAARAWRWMHGG